MQLHELKSITTKGRRRLGQGHGSGRVKTSGRGTKGQNARSGVPLWFEGGAISLIKRMPFHRGKGRNDSFRADPVVINVSALNILPKNSKVDLDTLIKHTIVTASDAKEYGVKILGDGDLTVALEVTLPVSKGAAEKIRNAGGSVENGTIVTTSA